MDKPSTFRDLIGLWPRRSDFAEDIGESLGRVHKWAQLGSIPAKYFAGIISAADRRGFGVTADDLVRIAALEADTKTPEGDAA